jgi:hypothetical protein
VSTVLAEVEHQGSAALWNESMGGRTFQAG